MKKNECIFCKIAKNEIPTEKLYEDDKVIAFDDLNPIAPVHFLVIPKKHIETLDDANHSEKELLGHMMLIGTKIARDKGVSNSGYRQVINCKKHGGQEVFHIHLHVIGGKQLKAMG